MFYGKYVNVPKGNVLDIIFDFKGENCNILCLKEKDSDFMMVTVSPAENKGDYEEHFEVLYKSEQAVNSSIILPDCFLNILDENGAVIMGVGETVQITPYKEHDEFEFSSPDDIRILKDLDELIGK